MYNYFRTFILLFIYCVLSNTLLAEDIYLKSGIIFRNIKVIQNSTIYGKLYLDFLYNGQRKSELYDNILKIDSIQFDENKQSITEGLKESTINTDSIKNVLVNSERQTKKSQSFNKQSFQPIRNSYPNMYFLSVAALGVVIGWDGFERASSIQDAIDLNNELHKKFNIKIDNTRYESEKTRATIMGVVGISVTLVATIYSIERVEINSDGKTLSMVYSF